MFKTECVKGLFDKRTTPTVSLKDRTRGKDVKETMVAAFVKVDLSRSKLPAIATDDWIWKRACGAAQSRPKPPRVLEFPQGATRV